MGEIEELLGQDARLKPYAILDWLKQKHNTPGEEPRVTNALRRTLERRVQRWKLDHLNVGGHRINVQILRSR